MASEALFIVYLLQKPETWPALLLVATVGNSVGSLVMYEMARVSNRWLSERVQGMQQRLNLWHPRLRRIGPVVLVLAWLPVVGDALPIAAGLLKLPRISVYFWISLGKFSRYAFIVWVSLLS